METISENRCFGGTQGVYRHASDATGTDMTFGLFLPAEAEDGPVPVLWYLSGLTCTHENAMVKAGAQLWAAEQGIALVFPDTSPRGPGVPDDDGYDLGQGAGFYVNATQDPWAEHFQMWDYITEDLPRRLFDRFALDPDRQGITGHSMGGHGALTIAMNFPDRFASVSAFSPICNPMESDWGRKQFTAYLGENTALWEAHDATMLMRASGFPGPILIDTGTADQFGDLLMTEALAEAIAARRQPATLRMQPGYDHSYFFVSTFIEDHLSFPRRGAVRCHRMTIEAVVFDIGNVLIEWAPERVYDRLLGRNGAGICSRRSIWRDELRGRSRCPVPRVGSRFADENPLYRDEILLWHDRWIDMASPAIDHSVTLLRALRAKGIAGLCPVEFRAETFDHACATYDFLNEFDRAYISAHHRIAKPDPAFYAVLETDSGLSGASLLSPTTGRRISRRPRHAAGTRICSKPPKAGRAALSPTAC